MRDRNRSSHHVNKERGMPEKITVYILAANRLLREALGHILRRAGFEVVGATDEPRVGLDEIAELQPSVILLNGSAPQADCESLVVAARKSAPESPVVLFGAREDFEAFFWSIRAGVVGFVPSESPASDVVAAVRCALRGEALCPPRLCRELFKYVAKHASITKSANTAHHRLTRREQQLLPLISQGLTNKEIAARLILSELTVKNHVARILRKTGTRDRLSAVQAAEASAWGIGGNDAPAQPNEISIRTQQAAV
jgi:DNA-binding NarL/FixJ family response regulator